MGNGCCKHVANAQPYATRPLPMCCHARALRDEGAEDASIYLMHDFLVF